MADNTLTGRCLQAYYDAAGPTLRPLGVRAVIEHLAAELTVMGHIEAGRSLLAQLNAQVIPLRPRTEEPA
jgi:hypothetical protein